MELYQAAYLFDHERRVMQKALLYGIEFANDYFADKDSRDHEILGAYGVDQRGNVRNITDPKNLNRLDFDHKVGTNRNVLTQLIRKCFGISLAYPNRLEKTQKS
jgi:hypothetical protein